MKPTTLAALIAVLLIPIAILAFYKGDDADKKPTSSPTPSMTPTPSASASPSANGSQPADAVSASKVKLKTEKGDILITLYKDKAPKSVANFATLGKRGYYDNVVFHRVSKSFMIQSGDPTGTGTGGQSIYGDVFEYEDTGEKFVKGSLGMARPGYSKDANGSQFFIMTERDYPSLDGQYTNFGKVEDEASMAVVRAIGALEIGNSEKPSQLVKITGFEIVQ